MDNFEVGSNDLLTIEDAALVLGLIRPRVLVLIDKGEIKSYKDCDGDMKITQQDLSDFIKRINFKKGMAELTSADQDMGLYD